MLPGRGGQPQLWASDAAGGAGGEAARFADLTSMQRVAVLPAPSPARLETGRSLIVSQSSDARGETQVERARVVVVAASAAMLSCAALLPVAHATAAGMAQAVIRGAERPTAIEVPHSGVLNEGGDAEIFEVSCPSG